MLKSLKRIPLSVQMVLGIGIAVAAIQAGTAAFEISAERLSLTDKAAKRGDAALDMLESVHTQAMLNRKEVDAALAETGVRHLAKAEVQNLSGGEFQRALLARAIARKPDLLVLDEPVQGVDFSGEIALYELITEIRNRSSCGVLLISHDLHVVMAATDTVICMNGHVCCRGTPETVSQSAEYRSLFGARGAGALAFYSHHHDHTHLPDGRVLHADGSLTDHCHPDDGHHPDHVHGPDCGCGHDHSRLVKPGLPGEGVSDAR